MLKQRTTPGILQSDVLGDGRGNQSWLPHRRQRNEIHAVGKIAGHLRGQPDAKAGLAAAARAAQCEEAVVAQEPSRFRQLMLPADKAGEWPGQVVRSVVRVGRGGGTSVCPIEAPDIWRPDDILDLPGARDTASSRTRQARMPPSQTPATSVRRIGPS